MTDLLTIAEARIAEKQVQEIEKVKQRLEADRDVLKQAIELVNSHTLYKKVETYRYCHKYVLVTEDMLKADYLKDPKYCGWQSGIKFKEGGSSKSWNTGILEVNGETYYDIRFALNAYEKGIQAREFEIGRLQDKINELKKEIEQLNNDFPSLKEAIEEWMAYQEEQKKNEE